jgi:chromosomal replication initiator protein
MLQTGSHNIERQRGKMNENFPFEKFMKFNNNDELPKVDNNISKFFHSDNNNLSDKDTLQSNENNEQNQSLNSDQFDFDELKSITDEILSIIKMNISSIKFNTYFTNTFTVSSLNDEMIEFSVTTKFIKMMIENHYRSLLEQAVMELMGKPFNVLISVMNSNKSLSSNDGNILNTVNDHKSVSYTEEIFNNAVSEEPRRAIPVKEMSFKIDSSYTQSNDEIINEVNSKEMKHLNNKVFGRIDKSKTFDNFVVGPSNNMAHAFSLAVSKDPGQTYPQLYLHGNSGLGKTHLLHAICNKIAELYPQKRICFTSAGDFTKEMVLSIQGKTIAEFQRKYTDLVDVLIIDDIHELKDRVRTQAEFFHIFNELQNKNKQLIFTSDKSPKEISGIEDRIRTRLSSALLTDIQQPDLETRIAILKNKANERDIYISDDVINLIASCVRNNVRELEGKLIKLGAYSDLMNVDIDLEIAKEQLNLSLDQQDKMISTEGITKTVASYYKLPLGDIRGKKRKAELVLARHISMYLIHKLLKKTLEEIGEYFDKRDHSTVIHAIDKMRKRIKEEGSFSQLIYEIESTL